MGVVAKSASQYATFLKGALDQLSTKPHEASQWRMRDHAKSGSVHVISYSASPRFYNVWNSIFSVGSFFSNITTLDRCYNQGSSLIYPNDAVGLLHFNLNYLSLPTFRTMSSSIKRHT